MTVFDLKQMIYEQGKCKHVLTQTADQGAILIPERQTLYYNNVKLEFDHKSLRHYDIKAGATIHLQDQGYQIPLRLGKMVVYSGPIMAMAVYSGWHWDLYEFYEGADYVQDHYYDVVLYEEGYAQILAKYMICLHFGKLLLELLLIHRMAGRMVSLNRTLWQILFYWVAFGGFVSYTLFHPEYRYNFKVTNLQVDGTVYSLIAVALFIVGEVMSFMCHLHFSNMEEKMAAAVLQGAAQEKQDYASRTRRSYIVNSISKFAILKDFGFSLVTCADWMWELVAWVSIVMVIQTMSAYVFLVVWFVWHNSKARERHWRYIAEYQNDYPHDRRAFIPLLI